MPLGKMKQHGMGKIILICILHVISLKSLNKAKMDGTRRIHGTEERCIQNFAGESSS
jgi:hypothetical protein